MYRHHPFLYCTKTKGRHILYNPCIKMGLTILDDKAFNFFQIINNKNISQIEKIKEKYIKNSDRLHEIIRLLTTRGLIYSGKLPQIDFYKPRWLTAWIHLTNQCNFRCRYCYIDKSHGIMSQNLTKMIIDQLVETVLVNNFSGISLKCAGGEPLLAFNLLKQIVNYSKVVTKTKNIKINIAIVTNGSLITSEIAQFLRNNKIRVTVSLDGPAKFNDKQRIFQNGQGTFHAIMRGIKALKEVGYPMGMLRVGVVVSALNIDGLYELTNMLLDKKIPWCYSFFRENEYANMNVKKCSDKKLAKVLSNCFKLISKKMYPELPVIALLDRVNLLAPHLRSCTMGQSYMAISNNGKISLCHMLQEKPLFSLSRNKINLIKYLTKNDREGLSKFTIDDVSKCKNCQWRYVCAGGCPLINYFKKGKFLEKSPYCNVYKKLIPKFILLLALHTLKFGEKIWLDRIEE